MDMDSAIDKEKVAIRKIKLRIKLFIVAMTCLIGFQSYFQLKSYDWIDNYKLAENIDEIMYESILLLNAFILAYSVVRIRQTIKSLHNAFTNESFIRVHLVNSIIYAILWLVFGGVLVAENKMFD